MADAGLDESVLQRAEAPWLLLLDREDTTLEDALWRLAAESKRAVVRKVRGPKMSSIERLLDEVSASLQFPYYFGENWNALSECLSDLEWLPADAYILVITNAGDVLAGDDDDFTAFLELLTSICKEWAAPQEPGRRTRAPTPFHVILHCRPADRQRLVARLGSTPWAELREQPLLARRWIFIAKELGLRIEIPGSVTLPSGRRIEADVRIVDFGGHNGILLLTEATGALPFTDEITSAGYGYSVLSEPEPEEVDAPVVLKDLVDMLRDWGWWGPEGQEPAWMRTDTGA